MPNVYDAKTGQRVDVPAEEAQAGLLSGKYGLDAADGPVVLMGPDGQPQQVDPSQATQALAQGLTFADPTTEHHETLRRQVEEEEGKKGFLGSLEAGADAGVNQLLLGIPDAYDAATQSPEEAEKQALSNEYHSTARTLGAVAGFGASMLIPGLDLASPLAGAADAAAGAIMPAAKLTEAGLATRFAASAAKGALEGAAIAAPSALTSAAFGDPQQAGETLLWGIGPGALISGGGEILNAAGRGLLDAASEGLGREDVREALGRFGNEQPLRSLGASKSQLAKLSDQNREGLGEYAAGFIKPGMTREELGDAIETEHDRVGKTIGDAIDSLDSVMPSARERLNEQDAKVVDAWLKPSDVADRIRNALDSPELRMPMNADQAKAVDTLAESALKLPTVNINGQDVVPFKDAQAFASSLRRKWAKSIENVQEGGGARGAISVTPIDQVKAAAYAHVRNLIHESADQVAIAAQKPELVGVLAKAKTDYAKLSQLESFAANAQRDAAVQGFNFAREKGLGRVAGMTTQGAATALGGAIGGPAGAVIGAMGGRVPAALMTHLANRWINNRGMLYATAIARKAAKEGPEFFTAALASEAGKRLQDTVQTVRDTIKRMVIRGSVTGSTSTHMADMLGGTSGLTSDQAYNKLSTRITELASNPAATANLAGTIASPLATNAPQVADAYTNSALQAVQYLYGALPKPPGPPVPFAPNPWTPTAQDKLAFHDKAEIVNNPMRAMVHVAQGTLSPAHLEALQTNYPRIYGLMRKEILDFHAEHPEVKLPSSERASVSRFLGAPLDPVQDPAKIQSMQQAYAQKPPSQGGGGPAKAHNVKDMPSHQTAFGGTLASSGAT